MSSFKPEARDAQTLFHNPLLMAGGAERAALTGKGKQVHREEKESIFLFLGCSPVADIYQIDSRKDLR
jgi:hypothetical protein